MRRLRNQNHLQPLTEPLPTLQQEDTRREREQKNIATKNTKKEENGNRRRRPRLDRGSTQMDADSGAQ
jgi:hypothetical protein